MRKTIFEKVNPAHPDKLADRIAGALLDLANNKNEKFIAAVEVLIGHGKCLIINETNTPLEKEDVYAAVKRIAGDIKDIEYKEVPQDEFLSNNQKHGIIKCGDNGIFRGTIPTTAELNLCIINKNLYDAFNSDGKYIIDEEKETITICQSNATDKQVIDVIDSTYEKLINSEKYRKFNLIINPLGYWTGGSSVDSGATNRKLGSDMGTAVTGGGLHGKDISKADLSINFYLFALSIKLNKNVHCSCNIGDSTIKIYDEDGLLVLDGYYENITEDVKYYIEKIGGYEKFAEYGLLNNELIDIIKNNY